MASIEPYNPSESAQDAGRKFQHQSSTQNRPRCQSSGSLVESSVASSSILHSEVSAAVESKVSNSKRNSKRKSIKAQAKWSETIRKVLQGSDKKDQKPDLVGEHVSRILNSHPAFQWQTQQETPRFRPLLSSYNFNQWRRSLAEQKLNKDTAIKAVETLRDSISAICNFIVRDQPTLRKTLRLFGALLAVSLLVIVAISHMIAMLIIRVFFEAVKIILSLTVDIEEIKSFYPKHFSEAWNLMSRFFDWVDGTLLKRYRISGREWDYETFSRDDSVLRKSQYESLIECPPPNVDTDIMDRWSPETLQHVAAINFCSNLLKEEAATQLKENRRRHLRRSFSAHPVSHDKRKMLKKTQSDYLVISPQRNDLFESHKNNFKIVDGELFSEEFEEVMSVAEDCSSNSGEIHSPTSPGMCSTNSDAGRDLNWLDVGTRIGVRLLNSEHVQRAITSQDTAERIMGISSQIGGTRNESSISELPDDDFIGHIESPTLAGHNKSPSGGSSLWKEEKTTIAPPVHSMWTSPSAAANYSANSMSSMSDMDDNSLDSPPKTSRRKIQALHNVSDIPSRTPRSLPPRLPPTGWTTPRGGIPEDPGDEPRQKNMYKNISASGDPVGRREIQNRAMINKRDEKFESNENIQSMNRSSEMPINLEDLHIGKKKELQPDYTPEVKSPPRMGRTWRGPALSSGMSTDILGTPKPQTSARSRLLPGVKVVVPMLPIHPPRNESSTAKLPNKCTKKKLHALNLQMGTVVSSKRLYIRQATKPGGTPDRRRSTNCVSVTAKLDKSFLRDGNFAEITFRVMDEWSSKYMPRHSKFPIGACVATSFGVGVLVGWRVEDDMHVVRALWQRKGDGKAHAYLNRDAIHRVVEASVGFSVQTKLGRGKVLAYVNGAQNFRNGRYFVHIKEEGKHLGNILEFNRSDIITCQGPEFTPIIEYIREAAQYQIQMDNYESDLRKQKLETQDHLWKTFSEGFDILWKSFLKAIEEEDSGFDQGFNKFVTSIIDFLDRLDTPEDQESSDSAENKFRIEAERLSTVSVESSESQDPGFWIVNDLFGGIFSSKKNKVDATLSSTPLEPAGINDGVTSTTESEEREHKYKITFGVIRTFMRTVAIARVSCKDQPDFRLFLSVIYEFLLFIKTVVKVHKKNISQKSVAIWKRTIREVIEVFGPVKDRLEKIGHGIAQRMEQQGNKAKVRILRFVDVMLVDEMLLEALERGEWDLCIERLERAMVKANIIEPDSREYYRKCAKFIFDHLSPSTTSNQAAARNSQKLAQFGKAVKLLASPRRSILGLLKSDDVLELLERILVRVFRNDPEASRMLSIHASNFHSIRHLRMLKNFTISGKLWIPLMNAADSEFAWTVTRMPENTKKFMTPLSKLFSLCVTQFHRLGEGDLTTDWLDFLLSEEAANLINEIDMHLILGLEGFCKDVKEVMTVLPYYSTIDEDFLNLMDEVDLDEFIKDASDAMSDPEKLQKFLREKTTIAIERFLDYLPKMSIPVEQRELNDGWVLTCRGEHGGDLTLSDVSLKRENLLCQILGHENVFAPFGEDIKSDKSDVESVDSYIHRASPALQDETESSVLDDIRELLLQAQSNGCWQIGIGGIGQLPSDPHVRKVLKGLPVSGVLNCGIELWRSLEIDDDELMEIAIKDVSYQIHLQGEREKYETAGRIKSVNKNQTDEPAISDSGNSDLPGHRVKSSRELDIFDNSHKRFNPRKDPTVIFLEMKNLTLHLDKFMFRIEQAGKKSIFDPVFDGIGSLAVKDVSIRLRVECRKERITKMGNELTVPILQLEELDVRLSRVKFKVKETGADWILNKAVKGFQDNITSVVEMNLKEQVQEQVENVLKNINSYVEVNPDVMLNLLGITMDDLEENIVWV